MRDALDPPPYFPANPALNAAWQDGRGRFLIDGFPRQMDQALKFDESVSLLFRLALHSLPQMLAFVRSDGEV